jgi:CheY-like chemotaxis protein
MITHDRNGTEPASRGTIVIANDDAATRIVLCQRLKRESFRVVAVENGRLVCEAARREHADVIVLDLMMPVMGGRSAMAQLRSIDNGERRQP